MEEPRRRRTLTPLSGELRATEEDVLGRPPPKPRASLRARLRRRRRPPPRTWREAVARGLARFGVVVGLLSGLAVGVAFLLAWLAGIDLQRALTLSFLLGGVLILAGGFFSSAAPMDTDYYYEVPDRERMISSTFVYVAIGFVLVGIGVILDQAL